MAVKAISEFAIQPGRREEFVRLFELVAAPPNATLVEQLR